MLQEMGITVWGPAQASPTPPVTAPAVTAAPAASTTTTGQPTAVPTHGHGHHGHAPVSAPAAHAPTPARPAPPAAPAASARPAATPSLPQAATATAAASAAPALRLHAARPLYPSADPAQTPAGLGAGWLIVTESLTPDDPLGGDAGRLLDNMLRAMQLHRHPRVHLAALERAHAGAPAGSSATTDDIPGALAQAVASLRPALVLVLGHVAARVALGRTEPLGRLRAGPHQLAGCPAVVTYDPAFLLRSQDTKAAAWADLCRALAIVRSVPQAPGAVP